MLYLWIPLLLVSLIAPVFAQESSAEGPTSEKAQRSYREGLDYLQHRMTDAALDAFRKADKQDGGHCLACQKKIVRFGIELGDWKASESAAGEMVEEAQTDKEKAFAHYQYGVILLDEGVSKHKDEVFARSHDEMTQALAAVPRFPEAIFGDGLALAHLKQDDAAKQRFQQFAEMRQSNTVDRQRALRYISQPELARARMAPPFAITTVDGQRLSLDGLQGKVVLIDFWATWCGPCRDAMPHIRELARKFQGEPLIVLSVSLDSDQQKWREFIAKNEMTWPQYFDGGFSGGLAKLFDVHAIPHTFTIDADGVLQDEQIGDGSIEGKLKKLVKHAQELQTAAEATPKQ